MASSNMRFFVQTQSMAAQGKKPENLDNAVKNAYYKDWMRKKALLKRSAAPIEIPRARASAQDALKLPGRSINLLEAWGTIVYPNNDKLYPPSLYPTEAAINAFGEYLSCVTPLVMQYGAIKLSLPELTGKNDWHFRFPGEKPLSKVTFKANYQILEPVDSEKRDGSYFVWCRKRQTALSQWKTAIKAHGKLPVYKNSKSFWDAIKQEVDQAEDGYSKERPYGQDLPFDIINTEKGRLSLFMGSFNLLTASEPKLSGIHYPQTFAGGPGTVFPWHVEDWYLYSASYLLDGAPKQWFVVPNQWIWNFIDAKREELGEDLTSCPQTMRHNQIVGSNNPVNKEEWQEAGFVCHELWQEKGDMMIIGPGVYHSGTNSGWNMAEAVNFSLANWLQEGKKYDSCKCEGIEIEPVVLDINQMINRAKELGYMGSK